MTPNEAQDYYAMQQWLRRIETVEAQRAALGIPKPPAAQPMHVHGGRQSAIRTRPHRNGQRLTTPPPEARQPLPYSSHLAPPRRSQRSVAGSRSAAGQRSVAQRRSVNQRRGRPDTLSFAHMAIILLSTIGLGAAIGAAFFV